MSGPGENERYVYEFGRFVVDPRDKTIVVGGESIQIPPKAFETLLLLIENNGRVVPKSEMMSAIWQDTFVEEGNLATYVSRLRKIINRNGDKIIETVPKLGYRFNADLRKNFLESDEAVVIEKRTIREVEVEIESESPEPRLLLAGPDRKPLWIAALVAFAILIGGISLYWLRPKPAASQIKSLAVLPLHSIGGDEGTRVLGLGVTDSLISKIGTIQQVIVRPTSAVAHFAETDQDSLEIGRRLSVDAVLEGTIQQSDGRLRINARLLRTDTGEQIWTERFEETAAHLFDVEDKLSAKIANTLAFELTTAENARLAHRGTSNADAYEKYLRGRFYQRQNTAEGLSRSIEFYQQALALDPNFADAHAGIADAELIMYNFGIRSRAEVIPKARQSVKRALELNPDLPDAYTSLAMIQFLADHDWRSAERSLQMAISLNPSDADAYHRYGYFQINIGKFDDALQNFERAKAIDPLSPIVDTGIGLTYLFSRNFQKAIDVFEKISADYPDFSMSQWFLGTSYESIGENDKAFEVNMRALDIEGSGELANRLRSIKESKGLDAANSAWLNDVVLLEKKGQDSAMNVAFISASLSDRENTVKWLQKAYDEGEPTISQIKFLQKYDFVREDPRFQLLEQKLVF